MASIELTVAYPGREGAHSAAACDRLFPAARLVPLPTFSDVVDAVVSGRVPYGVLPIESSLVGPVAETHDLLYESPLSIVAEAILPVNHCLVGPGDRRRSPTSARSTRIPSHSTSAGSCSRRCRAPSRLRRRRRGRRRRSWPGSRTPPSSRSRAIARRGINGLTIIDGNVGDHPEAFTRFVSVAPYTRLDRRDGQLADGVLVHDRSPPRRALPRARAALPPRDRPQPARLAADPVASVQLPVRRRPQRPPTRSRDLRDPEGDARPDGASCGCSARTAPTTKAASRRAPSDGRGARVRRPRARTARATGRYWRQLSGTRCAARRMKSTGAGARGGRGSDIETSSSSRSPLRRLHGAQAVTTFSQTESPPFDRGITWSSVSRPPAVPQ